MPIAPHSRKALYQNVLLLAYADRELGDEEGAFLETLRICAGITKDEAADYRRELSYGDISFRLVRDREDALLVAKAAIGAASSDGEFHRSERYALLELGKAIGLARDELQRLVYDYFHRDVLAELFAESSALAAERGTEGEMRGARILIVGDDFPNRGAFEAALSPRPFEIVSCQGDERILLEAGLVFFHLLEDRAASVERLRTLSALAGAESSLVFIAERQQAYQIGYLLDAGAAACLVAPVYPEEIAALIERAGHD